MKASLPKILVVDDEEAILETMIYTFQDDYEVFTSTSARRALEILDENEPFAVVLTDQRMPDMSGVDFVAEVCKRHPSTVRMILTGFSDMEAIIQAINDGHVYAYITKPWESEQLKQLMKQAVAHHRLMIENDRLLTDLQRVNHLLRAVMDQLDTGAIAVDESGVIQAVNRPARDFFSLGTNARGRPLKEVLEKHGLDAIGAAAIAVAGDEEVNHYDVEVRGHRFRVKTHDLADEAGDPFGRVILFREVSHEPLQRRFYDLVGELAEVEGPLRAELERVHSQLPQLAEQIKASHIESPGMSTLAERISRTRTAIENWLDVDDAMAHEELPDAQVLQDRMRIAAARWPLAGEPPAHVRELARRVEEYYESGEKSKQSVL
ncbi:MAG: response regulator [Myxococcales bacterium]|nr:response regulator [Myxococcales bacterium]MDH5307622.1 response regulator [Myxococcales bacterium]MDH5565322.1 response regulator [Myxococcales bacterium]